MKYLHLFIATLIVLPASAEQPRVLTIGDSISLGYTPDVKKLHGDSVTAVHNKGNAQHASTAVKKIDSWLGDKQWDVIHFNWGIWDLCYRHPDPKVQGRRDKLRGTLTTSLPDYERNLELLVARLKHTRAKLIWANTTVVPEGEAGRKLDDDLRYNEVAAKVMHKHGIRTNDLNRLSRSFDREIFVRPGDVHYTATGYQKLATQVAAAIRDELSRSDRPISRILFGSCIKQQNPVPIFDTIMDSKPDLFVFTGDNIYGDTTDMAVLQQKYDALQKAGLTKLQQSCEVIATWDDHDYGVNDGGASYPMRDQSRDVFLKFWRNGNQPPHAGVYDSHFYGPADRRVQVILLDTRYFRSDLKKGEKRVGGSWVPDDDRSKTMLGAEQWGWLEDQLKQPAQFRIIVSSIQFIAEDAGQEAWANLPHERQRMIDLLKQTKANGVMFISGDRHWSELSVLPKTLDYPLFDLTCSSLNQVHTRGTPTRNRHRFLPQTFHKPNFGVISLDWSLPQPSVTMQIRDSEGNVQIEHRL